MSLITQVLAMAETNQHQAFLIDASIYIFRSYFTIPENWHSSDAKLPTHAVYGFTRFLIELLAKTKPNYIFCAFDESLTTGFRHQLCPMYKSNRELPDEALAFQLNACRQVCRVLGVAEMASEVYEADDLIGAMVSRSRKRGIQPVIVSRDKDLMQLVGDQELYWDFGKSLPKTNAQLSETLMIKCDQMPDYLALVGDQSDSILGVPGVGDKTAKQLLGFFPTIEAILEHRHQLQDLPIRGAPQLADKLSASEDQLRLSKQLATIVTHTDITAPIKSLTWQGVHRDAFELFDEEMGFNRAFHNKLEMLRMRYDNSASTKEG
jgi:5'-3' exonuclease